MSRRSKVIGLFFIGVLVKSNMNIAQEINITRASNNWVIVNDGVMGGRSKSAILIEDKIVSFYGQLSLANNGGFASARYLIEHPIEQGSKLSITVKSAEKAIKRRFQLRLRTNNNMDGFAYKVDFVTSTDKWQTFTFDISDFIATYRGRTIPNAPKLSFANVFQIGFLIADKNLAAFHLDIADIRFL